MAKRNSMSTVRRSRNRKQESPAQGRTIAPAGSGDETASASLPQSTPLDISAMISDERTRLTKAQAVLGCVAFALLYEDWLEERNRPSFVDAITAVQDLIGDAIERLGGSDQLGAVALKIES